MLKAKKEKMQAAQVYFPKSVYFEIRLKARKEGKAIAEWIRDASIQKLEVKSKKKKLKFKGFSIPEFKDFEPNEIDKIVYEL